MSNEKVCAKDVFIGVAVGSLVGAACGAASGYAGLYQICNNPYITKTVCDQALSGVSDKAIQVGCGVGSAIGAASLGFMYSAFKAIKRHCCETQESRESKEDLQRKFQV